MVTSFFFLGEVTSFYSMVRSGRPHLIVWRMALLFLQAKTPLVRRGHGDALILALVTPSLPFSP